MDQQFIAAGKVVPDGANGKSGFVGHLPQGGTLKAIRGNDPEDGFDYFLAPGFGINNLGHKSF
jgi:hypothetical protein